MLSLPSWAQTALTIAGSIVTIALLVLVSLPRWGRVLRDRGRALLETDPLSVEGNALVARGTRYLRLGADLRALRDSPAGQRLPPQLRLLLDSIPEDSEPPPPPLRRLPPPLPLLLVVLAGCTADLDPAKSAANATRDVGIAGAELLERFCTEPYRRAQTREEVDAIRERGCREAANAYDALRTAHTTLHAVISATEAGQCVGVSRSSRECNVAGAYVELAKAASQWATAIARLQDGAS